MKTIYILLILALQSFSSAATDTDGLPAKATFRKTFSTATGVKWEESGSFLQVRFTINDQALVAVYKPDGEFISLTRNISTAHLPLLLGWKAPKMLKNYWITGLTEVVTRSGQYYIIIIENSEKEIVLKSSENRNWDVLYKRIK